MNLLTNRCSELAHNELAQVVGTLPPLGHGQRCWDAVSTPFYPWAIEDVQSLTSDQAEEDHSTVLAART